MISSCQASHRTSLPTSLGRRPAGWPPCLAALLLVAACASPLPSHVTRLWPEGATGRPLLGLSTEDGVLLLTEPDWQVGDLFEIQFPVGNSHVRDWGHIDRRNDDLAIVRPFSSRLKEGRFATRLPGPEETVYLAMRDGDDEPVMEAVTAWHAGDYGNWIEPPRGRADSLARDWAGAGLYVQRDGRWEIVGMLAGVTAHLPGDPDDAGVGFLGIGEISRILPDQEDYFIHPIRPPRPDFEFGVPLQPGDIVLPAEEPTDPDAGSGSP